MSRKRSSISSRVCAVCGRTYLRRNLVEAWTVTNYGHRSGWRKEISKVCTNCSSVKHAKKVLMIAQIVPVSSGTRRKGNN